MTDLIIKLQDWFRSQCNGDWEHQHGVRVETLDNPGWLVEIDLRGTPLHGKRLEATEVERSATDWTRVRLQDEKFRGFGGPGNLHEILEIFFRWADPDAA